MYISNHRLEVQYKLPFLHICPELSPVSINSKAEDYEDDIALQEVNGREVCVNCPEDQNEPDDDADADAEVSMRETECTPETISSHTDNMMVTASPPGEQRCVQVRFICMYAKGYSHCIFMHTVLTTVTTILIIGWALTDDSLIIYLDYCD